MNPVTFLSGECSLSVNNEYAAEMLNICMAYGYVYYKIESSDAALTLAFSVPTAKKVLRAANYHGINVTVSKIRGLPGIIKALFGRKGLIAGAILGLLMIFYASGIVWDVRVDGNNVLSDEEIKSALSREGVFLGKRINDIDVDAVENGMLINTEGLSWITVNLIGTVAEVKVREIYDIPEKSSARPANIIASQNAVVEMLEIYRGETLVKIGDTVTKGMLLVSGVSEREGGGYRITRSAGRVLGRTMHDFSVEIPLEYDQKIYTGKKSTELYIKFFSNYIKIYKNSRNLEGFCDTIENEKVLSVEPGVDLPVSVHKIIKNEYRTETVRRSTEEAAILAYNELNKITEELVSRAEILERKISVTYTDTACVLKCTIICIEDIAETLEFEYSEAG